MMLKLLLIKYMIMFDNLNIKEQVSLLTELIVGAEYVCKFDQYTLPWWILYKYETNKNEI